MSVFLSVQKHTILPSPPERGRGVGVEGAAGLPAMETRPEKVESREHQRRLQFIRANPCSSVAQKTPLIRAPPWREKNAPDPFSSVAEKNAPDPCSSVAQKTPLIRAHPWLHSLTAAITTAAHAQTDSGNTIRCRDAAVQSGPLAARAQYHSGPSNFRGGRDPLPVCRSARS